MATLCFFGTFDPDAPRVKRLMAGWEAVGGTVVTCQAPMWPEAGARATLPTEGGLGRWLGRWLSTRRRLWSQRDVAKDAVAVVVPYPGHFDVGLARRLGKPVVFDPFLSLWDTAVGDRKLFAPGSLQAKAAVTSARATLDAARAERAGAFARLTALAGSPIPFTSLSESLLTVPDAVQTSLSHRLRANSNGLRDLGVKQAPFVVLIGAQMPSVLAEVSFLTNKSDATLLKKSTYRQQVAQALCDAVLKYQASLKKVTTVASRRDAQ